MHSFSPEKESKPLSLYPAEETGSDEGLRKLLGATALVWVRVKAG